MEVRNKAKRIAPVTVPRTALPSGGLGPAIRNPGVKHSSTIGTLRVTDRFKNTLHIETNTMYIDADIFHVTVDVFFTCSETPPLYCPKVNSAVASEQPSSQHDPSRRPGHPRIQRVAVTVAPTVPRLGPRRDRPTGTYLARWHSPVKARVDSEQSRTANVGDSERPTATTSAVLLWTLVHHYWQIERSQSPKSSGLLLKRKIRRRLSQK